MARIVESLLADVYQGLQVIRERGVVVSDEVLMDRARNIVAGLIGNYHIEPARPVVRDEDFRTEGRIR
jgi:hypothetical protein